MLGLLYTKTGNPVQEVEPKSVGLDRSDRSIKFKAFDLKGVVTITLIFACFILIPIIFRVIIGTDGYKDIISPKSDHPGVIIGSPTGPGCQCDSDFSPYGNVISPDTYIASVQLQLYAADGITPIGFPINADYIDTDDSGFWVATFDTVPSTTGNTTYELTVQGNQNERVIAGLTFSSSACD